MPSRYIRSLNLIATLPLKRKPLLLFFKKLPFRRMNSLASIWWINPEKRVSTIWNPPPPHGIGIIGDLTGEPRAILAGTVLHFTPRILGTQHTPTPEASIPGRTPFGGFTGELKGIAAGVLDPDPFFSLDL